MSDDCFFNPAACEQEEIEQEEQQHDEDDMSDYDEEDMIEGRNANIAFLAMAAGSTTMAALDLFAWKWQVIVEGTDADGETEDQFVYFDSEYDMLTAEEIETPYWRYASALVDWSTFAIMGTLTVTQALSMLGIAAKTNVMLWSYSTMIGGLISLVAMILTWMGSSQAWAVTREDAEDDDTIDENGGIALAYAEDIQYQWMKWAAHETAMTFNAMMYMKDWARAQFHAMTPEEREEMEDKHGKKHGKGRGDDDDDREEPARLFVREFYAI